MKTVFSFLTRWLAFGALFYVTSRAIRSESGWDIGLCLFGWAAVAGYFESRLEEWKGLRKHLSQLDRQIQSMQEFFCESGILKDEIDKFGESEYDPRHYHHPSFSKKGMPECRCSSLLVRADVLRACEEYYGYLFKRHPEKYKYEPDGGTELAQQRRESEFQEKVQKKILPIFERLHKAEPEAFPKDHIKWLTRKEMNDWTLGLYMTWLLPSLKYSFKPTISTPEGKAAFSELEQIATPGPTST